jgi:hypothetical protein
MREKVVKHLANNIHQNLFFPQVRVFTKNKMPLKVSTLCSSLFVSITKMANFNSFPRKDFFMRGEVQSLLICNSTSHTLTKVNVSSTS